VDITFLFPVQSLVYDPLISVDPITGEYYPSLAKQWVVTNDSKIWTFYLRQDVTFHDGSHLDASVVKEMFERMINPEHPDYSEIEGEIFKIFESCEIISEYVIQVKLTESGKPFGNHFPSIFLNLNNIYPLNLTGDLERLTPREGNLIWPVGTGPYQLNSIVQETNYFNFSFTRYEGHFRGLAPFTQIDFLFYPDRDFFTQAVANQEGEIVEKFVEADLINQDYWELAPRTEYTLVGHLNLKCEELRNPLVRLALNYALNREKVVETAIGANNRAFLESNMQPARIIVPRTKIIDVTEFGYEYNPELAESLLDQAGYPRKEDGFRFNLTITRFIFHGYVNDWLQTALESIGIRCTIEVILVQEVPILEVEDIMLMDLFPGTSYYGILNSESPINFGDYSNELMDKLTYIEEQTPVRQEKEFYEKLILELSQAQAPYLLLLNADISYIKAKSISSLINYSPYGFYIFNYSTMEDIKGRFFVKEYDSGKTTHVKTTIMENITLGTEALYLPFTDNILRSSEQLIVSTEQSKNINSFLPEYNMPGKFYKTTVNDSDLEYHLRCYYDSEDVRDIPEEQRTLYKWEETTETWEELVPYSANRSLQYVEVVVSGDIIVRIGMMELKITYQLFPFSTVLIIAMMAIISTTVVYNQKTFNNLIRRRRK
jgi:peptide/nickel transport system substrate-binding protein